jgi:hypothetical protein
VPHDAGVCCCCCCCCLLYMHVIRSIFTIFK